MLGLQPLVRHASARRVAKSRASKATRRGDFAHPLSARLTTSERRRCSGHGQDPPRLTAPRSGRRNGGIRLNYGSRRLPTYYSPTQRPLPIVLPNSSKLLRDVDVREERVESLRVL